MRSTASARLLCSETIASKLVGFDNTQHLGDAELVAILLGPRKPKLPIAHRILRSAHDDLGTLSRASPRELFQVNGVSAGCATRIAAAFELGRRAVARGHQRRAIAHAEDIYRIVGPRVAGLAQEVFIVCGIDIRNGLIDVVEVARGTVIGVEVHPREVFRPLIRMAAAAGVLVHNHPSGDPTPSTEDIELTRRLRDIGQLLGVPIIDHVVIAQQSFRSIAEWLGTELDAHYRGGENTEGEGDECDTPSGQAAEQPGVGSPIRSMNRRGQSPTKNRPRSFGAA